MSAICIVNLKEHRLAHKELNCLADELVSFALKRHLGVHFHARDYGYDLIQDAKMSNYFLLSDSFLYKNCEFLEEPLYPLERETVQQTYDAFYEKFHFMEEMLFLIFRQDVSCVELYLSTDGSVGSLLDFVSMQTNAEGFMNCLFQTVYDPEEKMFADAFPTVKLRIFRSDFK